MVGRVQLKGHDAEVDGRYDSYDNAGEIDGVSNGSDGHLLFVGGYEDYSSSNNNTDDNDSLSSCSDEIEVRLLR
jgi:hypothetical protein